MHAAARVISPQFPQVTMPAKPRAKRFGWFRLYNDFPGHPKWRLISSRTGVRLGDVEALLIRLFKAANRSGPRGYVDAFPAAEYAVELDVPESKIEEVIEQLEAIEYIAEDYLTTWDDRQPDKPDGTAAIRQQRRRKRRRDLGLATLFDGPLFFPKLVERDGAVCIYCLATEPLEVDHIIPICDSGTDDLDNLGLACRSCNARKAGRSLAQAKMPIAVASAAAAHARYYERTVTRDVTPKTETQTKISSSSLMASPKKDPLQQIALPLPPVIVHHVTAASLATALPAGALRSPPRLSQGATKPVAMLSRSELEAMYAKKGAANVDRRALPEAG